MAKSNWEKYKELREVANAGVDSMSPGAMALGNKMAARMKPAAAPVAPIASVGPTAAGGALGNKMQSQITQQVLRAMSMKMGKTVAPAALRGGMRREDVANLIGPELFQKASRMGVMQVQGDMVKFNF